MAKRRKTLKQKLLADTRGQTKSNVSSVSFQQETVHLSLPENQQPIAHPVKNTVPTQPTVATDYRYLTKDLRKTVILTSSVIIVELLLKLLHF